MLLNFLTGTFARTVAVIAVAALGFAALTGRLRWIWVGSIIGGIILIFGGAAIVDTFTAAAG